MKCGRCPATTVGEGNPAPLTEDYRCAGCGSIVCDRHDNGGIDAPWGSHRPEAHSEAA